MTWAVGHTLSKQKVKKLEFLRFFFNYALQSLLKRTTPTFGNPHIFPTHTIAL